MTALDIEIIIARHFDTRRNMIVPNVSWGLLNHEADMLIVTKAGYATEIEIKVSKADLLADLDKRHGHLDDAVKYLFFAVPEELCEFAKENTLLYTGIITISKNKYVQIVRKPIKNEKAKILTVDQIIHLGELSAMRVWNLKEKINSIKTWK